MHLFELTRTLIDIESITDNELAVGHFVHNYLAEMGGRYDGTVERIEVEPNRFNVLACFGAPVVTLSTHLDTVPPFIPSHEDEEYIWGRGACDVKGIIAAMLHAAERVLSEGARGLALLFVVGEERNSAGAYHMSRLGRGSKYLINGEPTECKLALGSKGALRYEVVARGKMAHSAYPELGEPAIEKLLDALAALRKIELPADAVLGAGTMNIGTIQGGRAPNVISDYAKAEILIRLVDDGASTKEAVRAACAGLAEPVEVLCLPAIRMEAVEGIETTVVSYTTDIPAFGGAWGRPLLLGPGTIHVAHTSEERVPKRELEAAVDLYAHMVRRLLTA